MANVYVFTQANDKNIFVFNKLNREIVTDKLLISQQGFDRIGFEYRKIPLDQTNALWRRTIARMVQKRPHQRNLEPARNEGQSQNFDVGLTEFPVGSVQGKKCWPFEIEQANIQPGNQLSIRPDMVETALQAAIAGGMTCRAGKLARKRAEIHSPAIVRQNSLIVMVSNRVLLESKFGFSVFRRGVMRYPRPLWKRIFNL